jgi:hypothetical protein
MSAREDGAMIAPPVPPVVPGLPANMPVLPPEQLNGIQEFGLMRNWVSFDAQRGKFICRNLNTEHDEYVGTIIESRVVRVMKDEDGNIICSAANRTISDTGRSGRVCESCEDRDLHCFPRWWIAWQDMESGLVFAHTLSQTGSLNFNRLANGLLSEGMLPSQALVRIHSEEARRRNNNSLYRRVQFARLDQEG